MKILVTGGAGYVGQSLLPLLNRKDSITEIIVYDNLSTSNLSFFIGEEFLEKVRFIKGDILNYDLLKKCIDQVDAVYHLASYTSHAYTYAQNIQFEQINQWGTLNLVRAIKEKKSKLKKIYYLSSLSIFGFNREIDLSIDSPQPTNAYAISKHEAEKYIKLLEPHCEVHILRCGNIFGYNAGFRKDSVLNNFIFNTIVDRKIRIYGDGKQMRPFVHIDNVAKKFLEISNENKPGINYHHLLDFNSNMNDIKDWLLNHVQNLEYTYLNTNIKYDTHYVLNYPTLNENVDILNNTFYSFKNKIRIRSI